MNINLKTLSAILFVLCFATLMVSAQETDLKIPADVKPFIGKDIAAIALESADLNGDGRPDHILVLENPNAKAEDGADDSRSLLILIRQSDGKLELAKQNNKVIYCRSCGGVFGDPFAGIRVKRNGFTVDNYGGSNWRWSDSYTFNYSRIDNTWQLVLAVKESFMATDPKRSKTRTFTPKKFGKVDIADFDPDKIK